MKWAEYKACLKAKNEVFGKGLDERVRGVAKVALVIFLLVLLAAVPPVVGIPALAVVIWYVMINAAVEAGAKAGNKVAH
jgi:hypothetical protein